MKMQMQSDSTAKLVAALTLSAVVMAYTVGVQAQDTTSSLTPIYGSQLMSDPERSAYQTKMRSLKTDQAREAFRLEHHEAMKIRAAARGVTLPNDPPGKGLGIQGSVPQGAGQGGATGKTGGMGSATGGGASAGSGSGSGAGPGLAVAVAVAVAASKAQVRSWRQSFKMTPCTSITRVWTGMPSPTLWVTVQNSSN